MKIAVACSALLIALKLACASFAGAFNFQEPTEWNVGDLLSTYQEWEASEDVPFSASNTPPTGVNSSPTLATPPSMSVQSPGFVPSSGGYYSFSGDYRTLAKIYNHGGAADTGGLYSSDFGTRVIVQTSASTNPDVGKSVFEDSIELVQFDGTAILGGMNSDLVNVTELFRQEVETPFGLADQEELLFEFLLPEYSGDFRVRFLSSIHSSFQVLRVDTLLVEADMAVPGDFNGDGDVDAHDLADWQASYGAGSLGDADDDGDTDGRDFLIWQRNYTGPQLVAAISVPEPTSLLVVIFGIIMGSSSRVSSSTGSR